MSNDKNDISGNNNLSDKLSIYKTVFDNINISKSIKNRLIILIKQFLR